MITAHQGGSDEALFVVVPLVLFAIVLLVAKRRAEAERRDERDERDKRDERDE